MKKVCFVAGLCAGIGLSLGTAAFASGSIQAVLFPSKVNFLVNDTVRQMDNADNEVLNYNNKTYIPLRTFADSMGAVVEFVPGSPETGGHNKINIYSGMSASTLGKQDPQGYVSYGSLTIKQTNAESKTASVTGLLKVNKPLTGKKIELVAMNAEGKRIGSADIDMWDRLQQGDIIELNQALYLSGSISSCQIEVKDSWALTTRDFFHDGMLLMNEGLVFGMGSIDPSKGGLVQTLQFKNQGGKAIRIEPLNVEYQIVKIEDGQEQVMFSHKLAPLTGEVPEYGWYEAKLPVWNLKDSDGRPVTPGTYVAKIVIPDGLQYTVEGSAEVQTLSRLSRFTKWEYDIKQDDIDSVP
ncbi:hypothetical protein ACFQ88_33785 [Paenibacillus sp. NPDC056579]|uniref:hypothetical protein n=1 Tax=Paenibacillus sp. NPDC056579 TaxID=3345871 RepID=UPI00369D17DE